MALINFLIFLFGVFLGIFGSVGGGALLVSTPIFILLGLPAASSIATGKLGLFGLVTGSLFKFQKEKKIYWRKALPLVLIAVIGTLIGTKILIEIEEEILERIISGIIILFALFTLLSKGWGIKKVHKKKTSQTLGFTSFFLSSIYGGFFGGGGKFLKSFILVSFSGLSVIEAAALGMATGVFSLITSLSIFFKENIINFSLGIPFALGMFLGGFLGAKIMVEKGEKFTKIFLSLTAITLSLITLFRF